ncbi:MAG: hypothetical protein ACYCVH_10525 [Ignavibacteriaceae bacterium]
MVIKFVFFADLILVSIFLASCGTSIATRYQQETSSKESVKKDTTRIKYHKNFDLTNYRTKLNLPEVKKNSSSDKNVVWYNYKNSPDTSSLNKAAIKTVLGYRILVFTSDNLDEADSTKSDVSAKTNRQDVYIVFDPPFYKVEVGDFNDMDSAKNLSFQLRQMGYGDSRVISSKINIFQ